MSVRGACLCSSLQLVIISYAWRPNPQRHLECSAKGVFFCTVLRIYCRWKRLYIREEKAFCTFSQQLNNPHALRIDRLPRETERGRDEEEGREERECLSVRLQGSVLRLIVLWYICVCVYVGSVVNPPLALARGPTQQSLCGWGLWRGSFLVGTRLL